MSAMGICVDDVAMEDLLGSLKQDQGKRRTYQTRSEARANVFDHIEAFHITQDGGDYLKQLTGRLTLNSTIRRCKAKFGGESATS